MSRPRYQRHQTGRYEHNGMEDGWMRPPGPAGPPTTDHKPGGIRSRGISEQSRYLVFWVVPSINTRTDLHCNFDSRTEALEHVAAHPDTASGGIWDTRKRAWVL
jgi:hypothetical protein